MTPEQLDEWLAAAYTRTSPPLSIRDMVDYGASWSRVTLDGDEIKVERVAPSEWRAVGNDRFEPAPNSQNPHDNRRFVILKAGIHDYGPWRSIVATLPPLTPVATGIKKMLDGSVN